MRNATRAIRSSLWVFLLPLLVVPVLRLPAAPAPGTITVPDDCNQPFKGSYRAKVKNRAPNTPGMDVINNGNPITLPDFYRSAQQFDTALQASRVTAPRTNTPAMKGSETFRVKLRCFVIAVKHEDDNDLHVEVGGEPRWDTDHLVVEIPPGSDYCPARKALYRLILQDLHHTSGPVPDRHIFATPVQVDVEGFLFLDGVHARQGTIHYADAKGKDAGRGMAPQGKERRVRGLWEIHPVIALTPVP